MTIYNVQPTYATAMSLVPYVVGEIANTEDHIVVSRNCETAAGIPFGVACGRGVSDAGCVIGGTKFVGVSVRDITLDPSLAPSYTPDLYYQNTEVALLAFGKIAVQNSGSAAAPGDPVWFNTTTGVFAQATGAGLQQITGAQWDTTTANGAVGLIVIGTPAS